MGLDLRDNIDDDGDLDKIRYHVQNVPTAWTRVELRKLLYVQAYSNYTHSSILYTMFLTRSEYGTPELRAIYHNIAYITPDRGVNTFSPEGRLFQGAHRR